MHTATIAFNAIRDQLAALSDRRAENVAKHGTDFWISEDAAYEITAQVESTWHIVAIEFTGPKLTFRINPRMDRTQRQVWDTEARLSRIFGNPPYSLATEFSSYSLVFIAN